jgi:hypothetical protein
MTTLERLEKEIEKEHEILITQKRVANMLCGENAHLAENPFSKEFLENVSYNSNRSFKLVLYLQLLYIDNKLAL